MAGSIPAGRFFIPFSFLHMAAGKTARPRHRVACRDGAKLCGCSATAAQQPSKLRVRVRFPPFAPNSPASCSGVSKYHIKTAFFTYGTAARPGDGPPPCPAAAPGTARTAAPPTPTPGRGQRRAMKEQLMIPGTEEIHQQGDGGRPGRKQQFGAEAAPKGRRRDNP